MCLNLCVWTNLSLNPPPSVSLSLSLFLSAIPSLFPLPPLGLPPLLPLLWFLLIGVWGGNYREGGSLGEEEEGGGRGEKKVWRRGEGGGRNSGVVMKELLRRGERGDTFFKRSSCWELTERGFLKWPMCATSSTSTCVLILLILLLALHTVHKWRTLILLLVSLVQTNV